MISLQDVRKVYGGVVALDGVSLEVEKGTIHGIVGPSGAGKSTLVRCLTGLERPTTGSISLDGLDITKLGDNSMRRARRSIGMVFQAINLLEQRTAAENIAYPLRIARVPRSEIRGRVQELLDLVGLGDRGGAYPTQLSGGQQQRIGIARALAADPAVLLCDEPTSALDSVTTTSILDLIRGIRDRIGVTVVIITHEMEVVRRACDSVTLLDHGRVVETGRIADVVADASTRLSHALVPLPPVPDTDDAVVDIFFTSTPGEATGSQVFNTVAALGGDITAATFETLGSTQVGRVALSAPRGDVERLARGLRDAGLHVEGRRQ
ncbi:MAG TPA: methionine ABC transporter ATP-binding protein [Actinomycetaceae bacterium]|nr:methionine ABC transporter ATP-binding protein [Actinomycetaceae bacterium]